jgi:hypothetical protein
MASEGHERNDGYGDDGSHDDLIIFAANAA